MVQSSWRERIHYPFHIRQLTRVIIVGPSLDVSRVPDSPSHRDYVTVTMYVEGLEEGDVQAVILSHSYSSVNGSGAANNTMISIGGNTYTASIPQYPYSVSVGYKVYLMDDWDTGLFQTHTITSSLITFHPKSRL